MTTADALRFAMQATETHVAQLARQVESYATTLAAAEQGTEQAEAALGRAQTRAKALRTAPDELVAAAAALLAKLDTLTTEDFARGAEANERERLRAILDTLQGNENGRE